MYSKNKNMKSRNNNKFLKIFILIVAVLLVSFVGFKAYKYSSPKVEPVVPTGPSSQELKQAAAVAADEKKQLETTDSPKNTTTPTSDPVTPVNSSIELSAKQESNSTVTIISKLFSVSSGTCTLKIVNGSKTVTRTASVIYQPEFSTCAGFSIPISELGGGAWDIKLELSGGSNTGSKSIILEVKP